MAQTLSVLRLTDGLPQSPVIPHAVKKVQVEYFMRNPPHMITTRNVGNQEDTWLGTRHRTVFIAFQIARYNVDIALFTEARLPEECSLG